ncbi:TPA: succinate dehydrogenase/fumarate reductase iron-sulfur subunit [Candidatus Woesearchaeota archaeon]|nr:succinate dehydrogenase/fumarate reductase iron-sulfur subunit [Candidatus Woesearchaeota archaeon]
MAVVIFEIFRYDPEKDQDPYYKKYAVEVDEKTTVIQVLRKIKDKADGSLTFRKGCGCSICGICAMRVDGKARLACKTRIADMVDIKAAGEHPEVRIDPISTAHAIKDLVIDESIFWEQLKRAMPWLNSGREDSVEPNQMSQEEVDSIDGAQDCIHCHACTSSCDTAQADPDFLGPEALTKLYRYAKDPRDKSTYERLSAATEGNLWNCVRAFTCIDECPKGISPADKIAELHEMAVDKGVDPGRAARHAQHFIHSLRKTGKLDEKMMPIKTLRAGVVGFVPDTIKMVSKGKMPPLFIRKIDDHKEVWHLVELAKDVKEAEQEKEND